MCIRDRPIIGFLIAGTGWGLIVGLLFAYVPDYWWGIYEFPSEPNFYYWAGSLSVPPMVGIFLGVVVEALVNDSKRRRELLRASWIAMAISAGFVFLFLVRQPRLLTGHCYAHVPSA